MRLEEINSLLDPKPMALEMGYERLPDGVLHVACRTDMPGCRGDMLAWWFQFRPTTQQYVWWNPIDHVSSQWQHSANTATHIGSIHQVEESFAGSPVRQLLIQLVDPAEHFDTALLAAAQAGKQVSQIIVGRGSESWEAPRDAQGRVLGSRLFHVCRDTDWGMVLRSHFFLGCDLPASGHTPERLATLIPENVGPALLTHCYSEFTFLSRFLPSIFIAENRQIRPASSPW